MSYIPFSTSANGTGTTGQPSAVILKLSASAALTKNRVITLSGDDADYTLTLSGNVLSFAGGISGTTGTFSGAGIFGNAASGTQIVTIKGGTSGSADGSAVYISNGASTISAFGNRSAIVGGGYDATTTIFSGSGLNIAFIAGGGSTAQATITTTGINNTVIGATTPAAISGTTGTFSSTISSPNGSSSAPTAANSAFYPSVTGSTTAYGGMYFDGSTVYSSFFGRVPIALSGINDGVGYVTIASGTPTLRALFSNTGLNNTVIGATTAAVGSFTIASATTYFDVGSVITNNQLILGSAGADYGFISNPSTGVWALGYGTTKGTLGTSVLTWSSAGTVTVTGSISSTYTGAGGGITALNSDDTSNTIFYAMRGSGGQIGSISRVTTTNAVVYNTTSDRDQKTNIRDFSALDSGRFIDLLQPRWFDWREDDDDEIGGAKVKRRDLPKSTRDKLTANNTGIIGFIAQEIQEVEDEEVRVALVRCGAITLDSEGIARQIDKSALVPVLWAEVKSLRARVAVLESV